MGSEMGAAGEGQGASGGYRQSQVQRSFITPQPLVDSTPPPQSLPLYLPHANPEPQPLSCRLQGLGVPWLSTPDTRGRGCLTGGGGA